MTTKSKSHKNIQPDFSSLATNWPSPFISREEIRRFTGGVIHPKTLANLDSLGKGPKGRIRVGKKVAYDVAQFIEWLESRSEAVR